VKPVLVLLVDCSRYHIISEIYSALIKSTIMEYEAEGPRRGEVAEKDSQARKLNTEDALDCSRWRKLIKDV